MKGGLLGSLERVDFPAILTEQSPRSIVKRLPQIHPVP